MFDADNVVHAFKEYLVVPSAGVDKAMALHITRNFLEEVKEIHEILAAKESRMYSASILLVYEGDPEAWKEAKSAAEIAREKAKTQNVDESEEEDDDDDDEDYDEDEDEEEETKMKPFAIKLIDFAHARWTPGLGPDTNMLQGVESTIHVLEKLEAELSSS